MSKVRHQIFDTAASSAGLIWGRLKPSSLATCALQWLKRKAEGGDRCQVRQKWNFSVSPPQLEAERGMGEEASKRGCYRNNVQ